MTRTRRAIRGGTAPPTGRCRAPAPYAAIPVLLAAGLLAAGLLAAAPAASARRAAAVLPVASGPVASGPVASRTVSLGDVPVGAASAGATSSGGQPGSALPAPPGGQRGSAPAGGQPGSARPGAVPGAAPPGTGPVGPSAAGVGHPAPGAVSAAGVPAPGARYAWPLFPPPAVVTPFRPPTRAYGPGHRGVDLAGAAGQPVLASRGGTVVFAGPLAGRGVVSVQHDDGLRTTYEPLFPAVAGGAVVRAGDVLGRLEPGHPGCPVAGCLHWGVRRDRVEYLDPLVLLRPARVRLLPVPDPWPPSAVEQVSDPAGPG